MSQGTLDRFSTASFLALSIVVSGSAAKADSSITIYDNRESLLERATERPSVYEGSFLIFSGEIDEIHSERLLSLEEVGNEAVDSLFDDDEILMVVGSTTNMSEESRVNVSGRVYPFDLQALEQRFELDLDARTRQELVETYSGKAMFIANTVSDAPQLP